jgi:hypothetical protein
VTGRDTDELQNQIAALRLEVQQLRELVRMLFEMMMDHEMPDDELPPHLQNPFMDGRNMSGEDFKGLGM